jgi:hypothetical protein
MAVMEEIAPDCSPLLRSVLYHYSNTPQSDRPAYLANLVQVRDRFLSAGALETFPTSKQIYFLRQAGWVALLADEQLPAAQAFFAASSKLLPHDLRECHLVVYVQNALLYLTRLADHQYGEAQALRLSPIWQNHAASNWRMVNLLLRHAGGVRQLCAKLLRDPGPNLDTLALTELSELLDHGMFGVSLLPPNDPALKCLGKQLTDILGKKNPARAKDTRMGLSVILLCVAAVAVTSWLLWGLVKP